jgi:hypothetical protein
MPIESRVSPPGCFSDLALDEWLAGEGTPRERAAWQAHAQGCEECRARREQRAELNRRYHESSRDLELVLHRRSVLAPEGRASAVPIGLASLAGPVSSAGSVPPAVPAVRRAIVASSPRRSAGAIASGALALAAGVLLFLTLPRDGQRESELGTRTKGQSRLDFYVKSGGSVRAGAPGEVVLPGDALRFVVPRGETRYLVVLGRDSLGVTSVYFPEGPFGERPTSAPAEGSGPGERGAETFAAGVALPNSVVLDAAPGVERFYGVLCQSPQSASEWRAALAESGELLPRPGCDVAETSITKAAP